jgi:hypothetical protein
MSWIDVLSALTLRSLRLCGESDGEKFTAESQSTQRPRREE